MSRSLVIVSVLAVGVAAGTAWAAGDGGPSAMGSSVNAPKSSMSATDQAYARAENYIKRQRYADAISELESLVKTAPNNAGAYNYLGYANRKLGNRDQALQYYMTALKLDPDHKGANEYLGELYVDMGDLPKAEVQLAKLKQLCPSGCGELNDLKMAIDAKTGKAS